LILTPGKIDKSHITLILTPGKIDKPHITLILPPCKIDKPHGGRGMLMEKELYKMERKSLNLLPLSGVTTNFVVYQG
jgi:hypothetical protein